MSDTNFSLIPVWQIVWHWRKRIIGLVIVMTVAATVTVLLLPKYYQSAAIVIPGNPVLTDKNHLFSENLQGLYSPFGSGDDLDRIAGIAQLDTTYKTILKEFDLVNYYELRTSDAMKNEYLALKELREDLHLQKTENGQLKIMMWHKDRNKAAAIVNRMVQMVQQIAGQLQLQQDRLSLKSLNEAIADLEKQQGQGDAVGQEQLMRYRKIAGQLQVAISTDPPALMVQELGYAAGKEDRPKKLPIIVATFFLSLLFGILMALAYHRMKADASVVRSAE